VKFPELVSNIVPLIPFPVSNGTLNYHNPAVGSSKNLFNTIFPCEFLPGYGIM